MQTNLEDQKRKELNFRAMFHFRCINYMLHCYASLDSLLSFLSLNRFKVIGFSFSELLCTWDIVNLFINVVIDSNYSMTLLNYQILLSRKGF